MNRKKFIKSLGFITAVGICPAVLESCAQIKYLNYSSVEDKIIVKKSEFKGNQFALISTKNFSAPIYLRSIGDNAFVALLMLCTHKGCTLNAYYNRLSCPCHGSEYSYTGEVTSPPAEKALTKFKVTSDLDNIYIHLKG